MRAPISQRATRRRQRQQADTRASLDRYSTRMADYKKTLNLPDTPFPDARRSREARAAHAEALAGAQALRAHPRGEPRPPALRAARRPAVRERRHPHRARGQQDPEGHHRQEQVALGLRRAVRAGLGLPRHADRSADRKAARQEPAAGARRRGCAALTPPSRSSGRSAISSGSACSATGTGPISRWLIATKPTRSARSACCSKNGYVYRGLKPVNWCFDCGSALAEAEVEYEDRKDPAVDVGFPFAQTGKDRARVRPRRDFPTSPAMRSSGRRRRGRCPRTRRSTSIPSSITRSSRPKTSCSSSRTRSSASPRSSTRRSSSPWRWTKAFRTGGCSRSHAATASASGACSASAKGAALELIEFRHPFYDRTVAGLSRRLRDARYRHRHRAQRARVRRRRLPVVPPLRHEGRRDPDARHVRRQATIASLPYFGGMHIWKANPKIVELHGGERRAAREGRRSAQLHALLAPQDARSSCARRRSGSRAWTTCRATTA